MKNYIINQINFRWSLAYNKKALTMKPLKKFFQRKRLEYTHFISHEKVKYIRMELLLPQGNLHTITWRLLDEEHYQVHGNIEYYSQSKGWSRYGTFDKSNPVPELEILFMETIGKDLIYF